MPIPKKTKGGEEKQEEEEELAAFLGRMVSDADREENAGGVGQGSSSFDFGYVYRPGPYNAGTEDPPATTANDDDGTDGGTDGSPKEEKVVSYEDVFKSDSPEGGNLFEAKEHSNFSFDAFKTTSESEPAEITTEGLGREEEQHVGEETGGMPAVESQAAIEEEQPFLLSDTRKIEPDAKAKATIVESKKSEGTLEWMAKFEKIGMKSEEQVTSIDDDGQIVQQGPSPNPFHYSFKKESEEEKDEDLFSPGADHDVEEYFQPLAGDNGQPAADERVEGTLSQTVEEYVIEEEIIEESAHSEFEPVASELLAVLGSSDDQEVVEFQDIEEEEEQNNEDEDEISDSSVTSGPIPEEVKMERDDLTSAYDPEAEYDASESSENEEEEEEDIEEEHWDEEIVEETIESESRGAEGGLIVAADVGEQNEEQDDKTSSDIENQSQRVFSALEEASGGEEVQEQRTFDAPDVTKKDNSRSWTLYILIIALLLLAGVVAALIVLSQQDRGNLRSSIVPIETPAPSQEPTITPLPTSAPSANPTVTPTVTPMPTESPSSSPTLSPSQSQQPTVATASSTTQPTTQTDAPIPSSTLLPSTQTFPPTPSSTEPNQPVGNNVCGTAIGPLVSDGSFNVGTIDGGFINDNVQCGDVDASGPGVWYYVLGTGGEMLAHTCRDTSFDSKITIFGASCDNLVCVEANDNFCGETGTQSAVSWLSNYREEYRILVSGEPDFVDGSFNLVVEARANDECSSAIGPLSVENLEPIIGNTLEATSNPITCDGNTNESPSVWYLVTGTGSQMTADLCDDTDFIARIRILTGSCDGLECIAVNDIIDCTVSWDSVALQDYYVLISGLSADDVGSFSMVLQ